MDDPTGSAETFYDLLGVRVEATGDAIHRAWKLAAWEHHPDLHATDPASHAAAEERMRRLNEAHRVLSDPEQRRAYDLDRRLRPATCARCGQPGTLTRTAEGTVGRCDRCHRTDRAATPPAAPPNQPADGTADGTATG